MLKKIFHKVAHLLGWNRGICDAFYKDEKLYMSFLCSGCGERSGVHVIDHVVDRELGL